MSEIVASGETIEAAVRGVAPAVVQAEQNRDKWATRAEVNLNDKEALRRAIAAQSELERARTNQI